MHNQKKDYYIPVTIDELMNRFVMNMKRNSA